MTNLSFQSTTCIFHIQLIPFHTFFITLLSLYFVFDHNNISNLLYDHHLSIHRIFCNIIHMAFNLHSMQPILSFKPLVSMTWILRTPIWNFLFIPNFNSHMGLEENLMFFLLNLHQCTIENYGWACFWHTPLFFGLEWKRHWCLDLLHLFVGNTCWELICLLY